MELILTLLAVVRAVSFYAGMHGDANQYIDLNVEQLGAQEQMVVQRPITKMDPVTGNPIYDEEEEYVLVPGGAADLTHYVTLGDLPQPKMEGIVIAESTGNQPGHVGASITHGQARRSGFLKDDAAHLRRIIL